MNMTRNHSYFIFVLCLFVWSYFSYSNWIGSSEFWPVTLSGYFSEWKQNPSLVYKFFFHLCLWPLHLFSMTSAEHIMAAKAISVAIGMATYCLLYAIFLRTLKPAIALLIILIILSSQVGFLQFGKIRSDLFAFFLFTVGYFFFEKWNLQNHRIQIIALFLLEFLMALTTPKAIFMIAALIFLILSQQNQKMKQKLVSLHVQYFLFVICVFIFSLLIFSDRAVLNAFSSAWKVAFQSLQDSDSFWLYLSKQNIFYNGPLFLLLTIGIFLFIRIRKMNCYQILAVISLVSSLVLVRPLQSFHLVWVLLILIVLLRDSFANLSQKILIPILLSSFGLLIFKFKPVYFSSNTLQLQTIDWLEKSLKSLGNFEIFDGLGIFPRTKHHLNYIGPSDIISQESAEAHLYHGRPEVVIFTPRMALLSVNAINFIQTEYRAIGSGYWLRKDIKINLPEDLKLPTALFLFDLHPIDASSAK